MGSRPNRRRLAVELLEQRLCLAGASWERLNPLGSLIYQRHESGSFTNQIPAFSQVPLEGGQKLTLVAAPDNPASTLTVRLRSSSNALLATRTAASPGATVQLQTIDIPVDDTYKVEVIGNVASSYQMSLYRNAAVEVQDSASGNEQDASGSYIQLGSGRFGILGTFRGSVATSTDVDEYLIDLNGRMGQPIDIALSAPASVPNTELIANGDFESGNLTGWTVTNTGSGSWQINNGAFDPPGPGTPLAPISGSFDVVTSQGGPSTQILSELITVPSGITAATLSWSDRIRNFAASFSDPNQEWRVKILNASGGLIQEIFSTNPGDPLQQVGPNARSFNVTSLLQSLAGQSIRLSFEQQDNLFYFNATLDNVSLKIATTPAAPVTLQLLAPDGTTVLATAAPGADNFTQGILGFVVPANGVYTLRASSAGTGQYSIVVTDRLVFDTEPNSGTSLRSLNGANGALGYLQSSGDADSYAITVTAGQTLLVRTRTPFDKTLDSTPPVELITNGGFESGNLTGWTATNSGNYGWLINTGTFDPPGPGTALPPISGKFDAVSYQSGPGTIILSQPITVPAGITAATLSWSDRIRNFGAPFSDPNQEWRAKILNASGGLIQEIFSTNPGDPLQQVGPNARSFNLTSLLQSLSGQSIRLSFEQQNSQGSFNTAFDDISLLVATGATGNPLDPALEVRDSHGVLVATDTDGGGDDKNAKVKFFATTSGTYRVTVSSEAGSAAGEYVLSASQFFDVPPVIRNTDLHLSSNSISENGFVTITGSFTDPNPEDTHSISINWFDGQTSPATVDQVHRTFTATHQYLDDGPSGSSQFFYLIVAAVSDGRFTSTAGAPVKVVNVDPVITSLTSDAPLTDRALPGELVTVSAPFTDAGTLDTHTAVVDWGDGTAPEAATLTQGHGSGTVTAGHTYAHGGVFTVTVTLTDDDTGSAARTTAAVVVGAGVNHGVLQIVGTDGDNNVLVTKLADGVYQVHPLFKVFADFFTTGKFGLYEPRGVTLIEVYLGAGNDRATIAGNVDTPVVMHGEDGNDDLQGATNGRATLWGEAGDDKLRGGNRNDVLDGGPGNDRLWGNGGADILLGGADDDILRGGNGADLLIGGLGADDLNGDAGDDLLIGGSTAYDANLPALDAILAEWNSTSLYPNRVNNLRTGSGPGLAGISLQAGVTVPNDGRKDRLRGSAGRDWFFADLNGQNGDDDELSDRATNEFVDLL